MHRIAVVLGAVAVAVGLCSAAAAAPDLVVGISDDYLKTEPARAAAALADLGIDAVRVTVDWRPGLPSLAAADESGLTSAIGAVGGKRVVVAVYSRSADDAPRTPEARDEYCAFVRSLVQAHPLVNDVVIWNEPNKSTFWKPQFDGGASAAPAAYLQLLLRCHQLLHELRPSVNVVHAGLSSTGNDRPDAQSNISHSPGNFVRQEGEAYRSLFADAVAGPQAFDTFAIHAYGESSRERPWEQHGASATIAMGDIGKLVQALWDAFAGTGQAVPGGGPAAPGRAALAERSAGIWVLENGYQTTIPADELPAYSGTENVPTVAPRGVVSAADDVSPATQATQVVDAVRVAYCSPYVTGYFNFLLRDDHDLGRWQSGLLWADWSAKPAFAGMKDIAAKVHARTVDCAGIPAAAIGPVAPKAGVEVRRVEWPKATTFNWKNDLWRFRIQAAEPATYAARLVPAGGGAVARTADADSAVLTVSGDLRKLYFVFVRFPERRLQPGRYRMEVALTSTENPGRRTILRGPIFEVESKPS